MSVEPIPSVDAPTGVSEPTRTLAAQALDAVLWDDDVERVAALAAAALGAPVALAIPRAGLLVASPAQDPALLARLAAYVRERPATVPAAVRAEVPIARRGEVVGSVLLLGEAGALRDAHAHAGPARPLGDARPGDLGDVHAGPARPLGDARPGDLGDAFAGPARPLGDARAGDLGDAYVRECLAAAATAASAHLAALELRERVEQSVHGSLLEQLLGADELDPRTLLRRAGRLGCDLADGAVAICLRADDESPGHVVALIASAVPGALAGQVDGRVYALLPLASAGGEDALTERVRRLADRLRQHGPLGVSGVHENPASLRAALEEAEFMLDVAGLADAPAPDGAPVSGTYRLLLRLLASHPDEVRALYDATVSPLVRYDEHHRTDLLDTLATYLELNGNMNATASRIYAHRHTVAYRLDRIRELTGLDPATSEHRERLGLGLKAHRLLRREGRGRTLN